MAPAVAQVASRKKSTKHEQSEDVVAKIHVFVRDYLSRTVKFAQTDALLDQATRAVWHGIKDKLRLEEPPKSLTEDEFVQIYSSAVQEKLGLCRQYNQSRGQVAGKCTYYVLLFVVMLFWTFFGYSPTKFCQRFTLNMDFCPQWRDSICVGHP